MAYLPIKPFTFSYSSSAGVSPADSTTYGIAPILTNWLNTSFTFPIFRIYIPNNCIIKSLNGNFNVHNTLATNENTTFQIRVNGTTITDVSTTVQMSATENPFSNSSLSISLVAGDYIEFLVLTPAWATNPTGVYLSFSMYAE